MHHWNISKEYPQNILVQNKQLIYQKCWDKQGQCQAQENSANPDQISQNVASDQGLHCLPLTQHFQSY